MTPQKNIAVLGSTGSIGENALDVIEALEGARLFGISGHSRVERLLEQARHWKPRFVVFSDDQQVSEAELAELAGIDGVEFLTGPESLVKLAQHPQVDVVVAAIVGRAGLDSTLAAVKAGKTVALANKETLVVAGHLVMPEVERSGAKLLPVDSEHNAIFQAAQAGRREDIERVILTASGGPFRDFTPEQLATVTVEMALNHPTWDMGPKITVDSATMMNKALEIIEARWLFQLPPDQIQVMIHPPSIIHSMVEFIDGSVLAQLSPPDMKLPIQYALTWPQRRSGPARRMDWTSALSLDLLPADPERFPALELGFEVAGSGGTAGCVLNAANEAAVAAFLKKQIPFNEIVTACRAVLNAHHYEPDPSLETLCQLDQWARQEVTQWIRC